MILSRISNKLEIIKNNIQDIKNNQYKLVIKENIATTDDLQDKDFELSNINNFDYLIHSLRTKINEYNKNSLDEKYKNVKIYQIIVLQISNDDNIFYYVKCKKIHKCKILFYQIKNKIYTNLLKNKKSNFKKTANSYESLTEILSVSNVSNNGAENMKKSKKFKISYNTLEYNLKVFSKLNKVFNRLSNINIFLKTKLEKINNYLYKQLLKSLRFDKNIMEKRAINEKIISKIKVCKSKKKIKIKDLRNEINHLINENLNLDRITFDEYCNFQIKVISL